MKYYGQLRQRGACLVLALGLLVRRGRLLAVRLATTAVRLVGAGIAQILDCFLLGDMSRVGGWVLVDLVSRLRGTLRPREYGLELVVGM